MSKSQILINQALAHHKSGRLTQAELMYATLLKNDSKNDRVLFLLGTLHCQQGKLESAIDLLNQAIGLNSKLVEAYNSLGNAYLALNRLEEAEKAFLKACEANPPSADAHNNLGVLLLKKQFFDQAISHFQIAIQIRPDFIQALLNLSNTQKSQGEFSKAEESLRQVCSLDPRNLLALNNLGIVLKDQNQLEESLACYQKILRIKPQSPEVLFNMGLTLKEMGRYEDALRCYDYALKLDPENAEAHFNKARILWTMEDYKKLWPEYEWRLKTKNYQSLQNYVQKKWDGSSLQEKSLLIQGEQGIGDEILFLHCLDEIVDTCRECFVECHPKLVALVQRSFPKARVSARSLDGSPSPLSQNTKIDYQIPLASLMQFLRPTRESFPQRQSYFKADPEKIKFWKQRLALLGSKTKVGISWKTQASDLHNSLRAKGTTNLSMWTPIFKNTNCDFINLQYGDTSQDKKSLSDQMGVTLRDWEDLDQTNDLDTVSALLVSLDLVISIDSSVAYLAGALGQKVWVAAAFGFGKQAGQDQDSVWQPSLKYFLQSQAGDWKELFARISKHITFLNRT